MAAAREKGIPDGEAADMLKTYDTDGDKQMSDSEFLGLLRGQIVMDEQTVMDAMDAEERERIEKEEGDAEDAEVAEAAEDAEDDEDDAEDDAEAAEDDVATPVQVT